MKASTLECLFNKVAGLQFQHRCLLVKLAKYFGTTFLTVGRRCRITLYSQTYLLLRGFLCDVRHPTWVGYLTWVRFQQNGEFHFLKTNSLYENGFIPSRWDPTSARATRWWLFSWGDFPPYIRFLQGCPTYTGLILV